MKTLKLSVMLMALFLMAGISSCSQTDLEEPGLEKEVTFDIQLEPKSTRADGATFGLGLYATSLKCLLYDESGHFLDQTTTTLTNGQGSVKLKLVGNTLYKILFWADAGELHSPYTIDHATGEVSVDFDKMQPCSEYNDAFYAVYNPQRDDNRQIILKRPFAQINFGFDDDNHPRVKEICPDGVFTLISGKFYTRMNLFTKEVSNQKDYRCKLINSKNLANETFPIAHTEPGMKYNYAHMFYAMVPPEGITTSITISLYKNTDSNRGWFNYHSVDFVPMKQNWRTNIYGSLCTEDHDYSVRIDNSFNNDTTSVYNRTPIYVNNYEELKSAISFMNREPFMSISHHGNEMRTIYVKNDIVIPKNDSIVIRNSRTILYIPEGRTISSEPYESNTKISIPKFIVDNNFEFYIDGKGTIKGDGTLLENRHQCRITHTNLISEGLATPLIVNKGAIETNGAKLSAQGICIFNKYSSLFEHNYWSGTADPKAYLFSSELFSANDYCIKSYEATYVTISNSLLRSNYGCLSVYNCNYASELTGNTFMVQASSNVTPAEYPCVFNAGKIILTNNDIYSSKGHSKVIFKDPSCELHINSGRFSADPGLETMTLNPGDPLTYTWKKINEPALSGTSPLTLQRVKL